MASVLGLTFIVACGGSGTGSGCGSGTAGSAIKGGFPVDKRVDSALVLRVTKPAFDFLQANAKPVIDKLIPAGGITIPSSCGGSTEICCGQMCSLLFDFQTLTFDPQPPQTLKLTMRAKLKSSADFKIKIPVVGTCNIGLDTSKSGPTDLGITLAVQAAADPTTKLTSMTLDPSSVDVLDLDDGDIKISGGILCSAAGLFKSLIISTLKDQLKKQLATPLGTLFCQSCTSPDNCSSLADGGCVNKQCMRGGTCMQQLGFEGLIDLSTLTGKAAGTGTQMEYYAVAGSYAAVEAAPTAGLSLGMLGGSTVTATSSCVPARPAPSRPMPPAKTAPYSGNTTPSGQSYHVGAGISTLELDSLGYSFYQSGALCISIGTEQADAFSSGLLSALIPSLNDLTHGQNTAVKIVLQPQQAPTFTLGKGTFKTDGMGKRVIDDPLIHLNIKDMAVDFYVYIDERYVRFMRQTADINVPLSLDVNAMNQIVPMIGDLDNAFGNVRVSNSSLLKEMPAQLARLFPSLLPVISGAIGSLSPITLPGFSGLTLVPVQITSTADTTGALSFLGLFLQLQLPTMLTDEEALFSQEPGTLAPAAAVEVETSAALLSVAVPTQAEMAVTAEQPKTPRVVLALTADHQGPSGAEWQYRLDSGLWHLFDTQRLVTIEDASLRLPGRHAVEVRGRTVGSPETLDKTPARLEFVITPATAAAPVAAPVNQAVATDNLASGCSQSRGHSGTPVGLLMLAVALLGLVSRRRGTLRGPLLPMLGTLLVLGAVGCKTDVPVTDPNATADMTTTIGGGSPKPEFSSTDELGRYQSAVVSGGKLYIAAYDTSFGDLAFTTITDPQQKPVWYPVDGLPAGDPQVTDGNATRGGYVDPGDDVGRFASLAFTSQGSAVVAYQDLTNNAVKLAVRTGDKWNITVVAATKEGMGLGSFTQLVLGAGDVPTVAYMVAGVEDAKGGVTSQLVVATAKSATPTGPGDWTKKIVESTAVPCAGLCGTGEACVYVDPAVKDKTKTVCKAVDKTCAPSCKSTQACQAAKCVDALGAPAAEMPSGTGLYARLVSDKSGPQLLFYNRSLGSLHLATGTDWKVATLVGDTTNDTGRYIGATIGDDGTLHVAYSSADGRLFYLNVKAGKPSTPELVDDGTRTSGTTPEIHQVGGGTYVYLDSNKPVIAYQDSTAATLELARRDPAWTHKTVATSATTSRGFYPQAAQLSGKWWLIDVVYDRAADALTALGFTAP